MWSREWISVEWGVDKWGVDKCGVSKCGQIYIRVRPDNITFVFVMLTECYDLDSQEPSLKNCWKLSYSFV